MHSYGYNDLYDIYFSVGTAQTLMFDNVRWAEIKKYQNVTRKQKRRDYTDIERRTVFLFSLPECIVGVRKG